VPRVLAQDGARDDGPRRQVCQALRDAVPGVTGLRRVNRGSWHQYMDGDDELPGVTTILNAVLAKPALVGWAARMSAEYVVDHWDELTEMQPSARLKAVRGATDRTSKSAMARGTRIHEMGERLVHGLKVDVPDADVGPVEAYAHYLDTWHVVPLFTETTVAHRLYQYGGTLDLIGTDIRGLTFLGDIKTGSGVYPDVALQLAAYRYAEVMLTDEGESPMPPVDVVQVMHVLPDTVRVVPVAADAAAFRAFLHLRETYRTVRPWKDLPPIGVPMDAPPTPPRLEVVP